MVVHSSRLRGRTLKGQVRQANSVVWYVTIVRNTVNESDKTHTPVPLQDSEVVR